MRVRRALDFLRRHRSRRDCRDNRNIYEL